jgi:hypothetical protein
LSNLEGYEASQAARRIQSDPTNTGLFELVRVESKGDFRETWKEETTVSIHSSEAGAYKAGLKQGYLVRPLKVVD